MPTPQQRATTIADIRRLLADLAPTRLEVIDESDQHAGHAGAREGGHFAVIIAAAAFAGKTPIQRHRLVQDRLGDLRALGIHALSITASSDPA